MRDFGDYCAQAAMAQAFLHAGEHGLVVACFDIDHAVRRETGLGERGREEVGPRDAPENLADRARCDPGCEQCGGCAVNRAIAATRNFMQRAPR